MKLLEHIKNLSLLTDEEIQSVETGCIYHAVTPLEELLKSKEVDGHTEAAILNWQAEASESSIVLLDTTIGLNINRQMYKEFGGLTLAKNMRVIFLIKDGTQNLVLTKCPEYDQLLLNLARLYDSKSYRLALCTEELWNSINAMFVEPLDLEAAASRLSEATLGHAGIEEADKDRWSSEARLIYNRIINAGAERGASDTHFIPGTESCHVLMRVDGMNYPYIDIPLDIAERICNIILYDGKIFSEAPRKPLDGKIKYSPSGHNVYGDEIDLRISIIPTKNGKDLNIRYLSRKLYTFSELGMSELNQELYKKILDSPRGLVLQVGPTGCGKSTTLYAGLSYAHKSLRNILTVEDPVEITMDGISQVDVSEEGGMTFAIANKAFLRHDPEIIVIGEIRDPEVASQVIRTANTGHLLISSLHANDDIAAIDRLIELGVSPYALGEVIVAIMGQMLVRRLCSECKKPYMVSRGSPIIDHYKIPLKDGEEGRVFYRPVGCPHCRNTGYAGRVAVNEILLIDSNLREKIQKHETRKSMEDYLSNTTFKPMYEDALEKAMQGITSLEELRKMAKDPLAFSASK